MRMHDGRVGSSSSGKSGRADAGQGIIRIVPIRGQASLRLLRTLAGFGVGVRAQASLEGPGVEQDVVARIVRAGGSGHGRIVLLQGESGCGKSTHLRAARRALAAQGARCELLDLGAWDRPNRTLRERPDGSVHRSLIDAVRGPRAEALALLSAVGLGDALLMAQDPDTLSEGQSARLRIASSVARLMALGSGHRAPAHRVLFIDEFASVLDRTSARTLCRTLAKLVRREHETGGGAGGDGRRGLPGLSIVLATAHDDVEAWLAPDLTLRLHASWEASHRRAA
jgi:hypothetical protein